MAAERVSIAWFSLRPYDPERAKHHLKKAGMQGTAVELYTAETAGLAAAEQALMLQQAARKAGLTIKVRRCPLAIEGVCDRQPVPVRSFADEHRIACHRELDALKD